MKDDVFRKTYKNQIPEKKELINKIKTKAEELYDIMVDENTVAQSSAREMALAKTNLEQSIMWAVKGLTF